MSAVRTIAPTSVKYIPRPLRGSSILTIGPVYLLYGYFQLLGQK